MDDVFSYVDANRERFVAELADYVRHPSVSATGQGMPEAARVSAAMLERSGLDAQVMDTGGWPVVLGRREGPAGAPTVLVYGHYDVQPPDPVEAWVSPPFEPTFRDGRLFARGSADNKGQHLAQALAVRALLDCRGSLPCGVVVLLDGEEESGSPNLPAFVAGHAGELAADLVVWSDGPIHETGQWCIVFGVRGIVGFELRARGANQSVHSGNWGGVVPNPLWTLVHLLATMRGPDGELTVAGLAEGAEPLGEAEERALAALPMDGDEIGKRLGLDRFDAPTERGLAERLARWPTLTINGLHGGYGGDGTQTIIPNEAVAKCDVRLVHAMRSETVLEALREHVRRHAPEVELRHVGGAMEPYRTPLDSPFTAPIRRGMAAAQGAQPLLVPSLGGSLPIASLVHTLGLPAFGVPIANADEANHAPNENLVVDCFVTGIKTCAAVLAELGAAG